MKLTDAEKRKAEESPIQNESKEKNILICPECKKEFVPKSVNQRYCSSYCGAKYRKNHPEYIRVGNSVIQFRCAWCGKTVVTDGKGDKRTRFCCHSCEKKYWRHPPSEHSALRTMSESLIKWREKIE